MGGIGREAINGTGIQPKENQYNWAAIDWEISQCVAQGKKFAFGVMCANTNRSINTPDKGKYGANAALSAKNGNGTGDVAMTVSENGYYLYLYFMFTNGYVVGVQFDCVDVE